MYKGKGRRREDRCCGPADWGKKNALGQNSPFSTFIFLFWPVIYCKTWRIRSCTGQRHSPCAKLANPALPYTRGDSPALHFYNLFPGCPSRLRLAMDSQTESVKKWNKKKPFLKQQRCCFLFPTLPCVYLPSYCCEPPRGEIRRPSVRRRSKVLCRCWASEFSANCVQIWWIPPFSPAALMIRRRAHPMQPGTIQYVYTLQLTNGSSSVSLFLTVVSRTTAAAAAAAVSFRFFIRALFCEIESGCGPRGPFSPFAALTVVSRIRKKSCTPLFLSGRGRRRAFFVLCVCSVFQGESQVTDG